MLGCFGLLGKRNWLNSGCGKTSGVCNQWFKKVIKGPVPSISLLCVLVLLYREAGSQMAAASPGITFRRYQGQGERRGVFPSCGSPRGEEPFTGTPHRLPVMSLQLELGHLPILEPQTSRGHGITIGPNKMESLPQGGMWEGDIRPKIRFPLLKREKKGTNSGLAANSVEKIFKKHSK